jgi:hypothetical protein
MEKSLGGVGGVGAVSAAGRVAAASGGAGPAAAGAASVFLSGSGALLAESADIASPASLNPDASSSCRAQTGSGSIRSYHRHSLQT